MIKSSWLEVLQCPASGETLSIEQGRLSSTNHSYPFINGLPCLYMDPENELLEWSSKIKNFLQAETLAIKDLQRRVNQNKNDLARKRLSLQLEARSKNLKFANNILHDFMRENTLDLIPSTQQIQSYFQLIFRDWCWDARELKVYLNFVQEKIQPNQKVLILGSGAGGLSLKLAHHNPKTQFVSIEHNPLLASTCNQVSTGKSIKLFEYSQYPRELKASAKKWEIQERQLETDNHLLLLASFPNLPLKDESFDLIIAPWFFDILDIPFINAVFAARDFLKPDGSLLFIGPANVHKNNLVEQFSQEEIIRVMQKLFSDIESETQDLFYLDSPLESQRRLEQVLFLRASQKTQFDPLELESYQEREDIVYSAQLEQLKLTTEIKNKILKLIDKDMSFESLAKKLEREFQLSPSESLHYAKKFIASINFEIF